MLNTKRFGRFGLKDLNTSEERRRKRFNENLKLQKLSRTESWFERRNKPEIELQPPPLDQDPEPMDVLDQLVNEIEMMDVNNNNSSLLHTSIQRDWIVDLQHTSAQRQWTVVGKFVRLITSRPHPALEDCVKLGLFTRFFELLKTCVVQRVQHNVAIILCEMSDCEVPIDDQLPVDAVESIETVFSQTYHLPIKLCLLEFMGNICSDKNRSELLNSKFWTMMIEMMHRYDFDSDSKEIREVFRLGTYAFRRFCAALSPASFDRASMALPVVVGLLNSTKDRYVLRNCILTLNSFTLYSNRSVLALKINARLTEMLDIANYGTGLVFETMRVVGNILYGEHDERQEILDAGVLPKLRVLMFHENELIKIRASWAISNVCCGSQEQIELLLVDGLYRDIVEQFRVGQYEVQYEFAHGINCSISKKRASREQIERILELDVIGALCDSLKTIDEVEILVIVMRTLRRVVRLSGEMMMRVFQRIDIAHLHNKLKSHSNADLRDEAQKLATYFDFGN